MSNRTHTTDPEFGSPAWIALWEAERVRAQTQGDLAHELRAVTMLARGRKHAGEVAAEREAGR